MKTKIRLDLLLQQQQPHISRRQCAQMITDGQVTVDGRLLTKPGALVTVDAHIECAGVEQRFVSRAGFKLEKALEHFGIDVAGMICLDAGLSTGGFTDCLVQRGASRVYGVDVGSNQTDPRICGDPRVTVIERTNLRELQALPDDARVDCVTLDLSFISVLKVMPAVVRLMKPTAVLIILIKPQFEVTREQIGRGGIIKDPAVHKQAVAQVTQGMSEYGFACQGVIESPIKGSSGNTEFLGYFTRA